MANIREEDRLSGSRLSTYTAKFRSFSDFKREPLTVLDSQGKGGWERMGSVSASTVAPWRAWHRGDLKSTCAISLRSDSLLLSSGKNNLKIPRLGTSRSTDRCANVNSFTSAYSALSSHSLTIIDSFFLSLFFPFFFFSFFLSFFTALSVSLSLSLVICTSQFLFNRDYLINRGLINQWFDIRCYVQMLFA